MARKTPEYATITIQRTSPPRTECFEGRWLIDVDTEDDSGSATREPDLLRHSEEAPAPPESWRGWIGETAKGNIVVYIHHWAHDPGATEVFEVFETFDAARARYGRDPRFTVGMWNRAAETLSTADDVVWLDI